jgi:UDP-3-O-[3-hydroxymyristoyl] glucosamine N-acyltransferase
MTHTNNPKTRRNPVPPISVRDLCAKLNAEAPSAAADKILIGIATLDRATAQHVSFVQKERHAEQAKSSQAALLLAPLSLPVDFPNVVRLKDLMGGVITVMEYFHPEPAPVPSIHPTAVISSNSSVSPLAEIGPNVVVEDGAVVGAGTVLSAGCFIGADAQIGDNCRFAPGVVVLSGTNIGHRVQIHPGTVIGADGFRYEVARGRLSKIPQVGIVVIEDDVEIGANCTIDRAFLNETRIGARTKIDNLVHIGHNVLIGSDCLIVAQVGVGGSAKVGRGVIIAGQSGVGDHVTIGDRGRVGGQSGVHQDVPPGKDVMGYPAIPASDFARFAYFAKNFRSMWKKRKSSTESEKDGDQE